MTTPTTKTPLRERDRLWDAILGELNLSYAQGAAGEASTNMEAADRIRAALSPPVLEAEVADVLTVLDGWGLTLRDRVGRKPAMHLSDVAALIRRLAASPAVAAQQAVRDGWQPKPTKPGHYWHFDGELTRMQFVFPRPGHSYLAVYDEPNQTTGKRQFRMAEKIGGQWYGPLALPAPPSAQPPESQEGQ